jgi:hypothetical protein
MKGWPHNSYLYYLYIGGVGCLASFLLLIWRLVKRTYAGTHLRIRGASLSRGLAATYHVGILQILMGQVRTDHQRGDLIVYVMWTIFSLGMLAREVWEQEKRGVSRTGGRPAPVPDPRLIRAQIVAGTRVPGPTA